MRTLQRRWGALALALAAVLAGPATLHAAPLDDVLDADRAFAALAVKAGARAAFVAFAANDAMMFQPHVGPIKGHAAIAASFDDPDPTVPEWAPEGGEVAASGDLAYTWGYFKWTRRDGTGKPFTGNYVSIWRRIDGQWKWIVDLGVPGPARK